jgi:hypothetical protein
MSTDTNSTTDARAKDSGSFIDGEEVKLGITPSPTKSDLKSDEDTLKSGDASVAFDNSSFNASRILFVQSFLLFTNTIEVVDLSGHASSINYDGGEISTEVRKTAQKLSTKDDRIKNKPLYRFARAHWWKKCMLVSELQYPGDGSTTSTEIAHYKHSVTSSGTATFTFPDGSKHSSHEISLKPQRLFRRTNTFVQDSVDYEWHCDSRWKSNRMTLVKSIGGRKIVVARYAQKWGDWSAEGVILIDEKEIDVAVAALTAVATLKKMVQRAAERAGRSAGAGGGS